MSAKARIVCVPFPGSGHAVNMFNVAHALATPQTRVHVLVMSRKYGLMWQKAAGLDDNPNVRVDVINDGKDEEFHPSDAREIVGKCQSVEFSEGVRTAVQAVRKEFPGENVTSILFNGLMTKLAGVAKEEQLKTFLLMPTGYYMGRLAGAVKLDGSSQPTDPIVYKGIGGSAKDMNAILGDAVDMMSDMYHKWFKPLLMGSNGLVWSNTNQGLEGELYHQEHEPNFSSIKVPDYMIGPILPPSYERALDDPNAMKTQLAKADQSDPCVQFLNTHASKSVVYIAMGSHGKLSVDQSVAIIHALRKHSQPWIMLCREDSEKLEQTLGEHNDGVITRWAPQLEVMLHPATKCVLSHGGFGTMIEGVYAGQPFITSPMFSDQFLDTRVMQHLGICVGNIAINKFESVMSRAVHEPRWPDDGGKLISEVFERAFGSGGDEVLERARAAARDLRSRMAQEKQKKGAEALDALRKTMLEPQAA